MEDTGLIRQAQPDALDHLGQVLLAQVSVDVGGTGLSTVSQCIDGAASTPTSRPEVRGWLSSIRLA